MVFKNKKIKTALVLGLLLFVIEVSIFSLVILNVGTNPTEDFDLVLTYSGDGSMETSLALALSKDKPLFVSIAPWEPKPFQGHSPADLKMVYIDATAATTDQNARRAASFIHQKGYKRVVLDVGWFHMPRALFLTRLYLLGSGVVVIPCSRTPAPPCWWAKPIFLLELYKFWGSIGRVILAFCGWENGPSGPHIWT